MMKWFLCLLILFFCQQSTVNCQPKYEFRAVWIATVNNIDWPSSKYLTSEQQQQEFINILNRQREIGMNAVIVQIRPSADAFYASKYEPWSEFLTGRQGAAPSTYYDPLQFMIDETHKRGMEFHAWINPYRAVFSPASSIASNHITRQHPEWFVKYGDRRYFNPGIPAVMQYLKNVVIDIITRYDIDGLHMDDYFYPYRIAGKEFPDYPAYKQYGNGLSKDAWRRSNCDTIVKMIHDAVVTYKPSVKFGISPFGVWRNSSVDPRGSDTRAGQTCYDDLYADILLWLKEGWVDYITPQLYWEIGNKLCDYETLLNWWSANTYGKQLYIGHGIYRVFERPTPAWRNPDELPDEIKMLRNDTNVQGSVFYSSKPLLYNPNGWADSLRFNYYRTPALIAPMDWVDTTAPQHPRITKVSVAEDKGVQQFTVSGDGINNNETETIKNFVVYLSPTIIGLTDHPAVIIPATASLKFEFLIQSSLIPADWKSCYVTITSVDRENNESHPSNIFLLEKNSNGWEVKK
ncbi:MAG TPA: family 10 glycosylhydrolase [Parafilimonas sp.]|nr:family 10 glycosylhydrolase [Parafilimonas sp.]